jgi:hypothetical protein
LGRKKKELLLFFLAKKFEKDYEFFFRIAWDNPFQAMPRMFSASKADFSIMAPGYI